MDQTDSVEIIYSRMRENGEEPAFHFNGVDLSYREVTERIDYWFERLPNFGITTGAVCSLIGDYSPESFAIIFALARLKAIVVPLSRDSISGYDRYHSISGAQYAIVINAEEQVVVDRIGGVIASNSLVEAFLVQRKPGLIVFTSGSTGTPKGILHDFERVLSKFVIVRPGWRTILFLTFDHFGGLNTLFSTVAYGGVAICVSRRTPDQVCKAIENARASLLPTTPTFLNLLLISRCNSAADLTSIKLITYGTEVMSETTLCQVRRAFPNAAIKQTYGLSELGVLRSKSESSDSTWMRLGGDGFDVKIVDDVLWVKARSNMIGYINAPSPFDADGWFCTQDHVEVRGDYFRILGRKSDLIIVGGEKVFPLEVETVLLQADNIQEVAVFSASHPVMGNVVNARVTVNVEEDPLALTQRLRKFCLKRLARYKVPVRFLVVSPEQNRTDRFKKIR